MILLTGASGFIGKHLLARLVQSFGAESICALTSAPIDGVPFLLHQDYTFGRTYFEENGMADIEIIIHAGAFTPKSGKEANDYQLCTRNIINTGKLLDANLPNLKKILYLSTLDVYGADGIISEDTVISPVSLYGHSKYYGERMIEEWGKQHDKIVQILRIGHVYGPGEEAYRKIIPVAIKKCINKEPVEIWGTGEDLRSFIFIDDIITAIINAIALENGIGTINLVSGHKVSINDLVEKIMELTGNQSPIIKTPVSEAGRDMVFDNSKLKKYLLPTETSLEQGLRSEIEYMKTL